jgi:hypothetical protein
MSFSYHVHSSFSCTRIHHTGSQEETPVVKREDPEGGIPQEVPGDEEQDVELPECTDHQPSSFEKGKPWSISLPTVCK